MKYIFTIILLLANLVCFGALAKVIRVIDGDTFEIESGEKIRLIGINAPEISDIFGQEAKQHLMALIDGKTIDLQQDNISNDRDRYSRLLRYVISNGKDINKQMISDGFAFAYLKYHFDKSSEYREAQIVATKNNIGMWGNGNNKIIKAQKNDGIVHHSFFSKEYFIISIIAILVVVGLFYYLKK